MQKTQEFKVGDIVRFKSEHEHYANRWSFPITNLKISKIKNDFHEDGIVSLLFIEGREGCVTSGVYDFRVELETSEKPNMFAVGRKNPKIKKVFLDYTKGRQRTGLCGYLNDFTDLGERCFEFLNKQIVFTYSKRYPVEHFVLRSKKKSTIQSMDLYDQQYENGEDYTNSETPMGKLRIWWATNLAIAASQGKI